MVTSNGLQKGLKWVLEECGINVTKMNKEEMIKVLEEMRDFKFQKTQVEELILSKGHRVMFIPISLNVYGVMPSNIPGCTVTTHFKALKRQ